MLFALLLAAATPQTAIDAERAFAAAAQKDGQWTAFRRFAADDATMFVPLPTNAQAFLKPLKDPPTAIAWSPIANFVSCDGKTAANTGEWRRPDGRAGFFSTIWARQPRDGWKWTVDGGDLLTTARPPVAVPVMRRASCKRLTMGAPLTSPEAGAKIGIGGSADGTLRWRYNVTPDGARTFTVTLWNGSAHETVIDDRIPAPTK